MSPHKVITLLLAPITGMMPVVVFLVCDCFFHYPAAFVAALATFVVYFISKAFILKEEPSYMIWLSIVVIVLSVVFSLIKPFGIIYAVHSGVVVELLLVLVFYVFVQLQDYFRTKIIHGKHTLIQDALLLKFDSNLYVIKVNIVLIAFHLWIVLMYQLFPDNYHSAGGERFIYYYLLFLLIALHYVYELMHWSLLRKQVRKEEWLPVVDESGAVHGKVALSVSLSENKYLHPVVRIVLIHKGMLFLKPRGKNLQLDYPFERFLRFGESLDGGVREILNQQGGTGDLPTRFILHYVHKETNRLIYLYICTIADENVMNTLQLHEGKWWTSKQIDENLSTGLFSPYFEEEYEILHSTILSADRLMHDL